MSRFMLRALSTGITAATLSVSAHAATEITWWHSMGGELGERLSALAEDFECHPGWVPCYALLSG